MRESVIDVLFYLFDDLLNGYVSPLADVEKMADQLSEAGFTQEEVNRAMAWFVEFSELNQYQPPATSQAPVLRLFSEEEAAYIDDVGQNYLLGLLRRRIINNAVLEKVIDRALALEEPLDEYTIRWVATMVALNVYGHIEDIHAFGLDEPVWPANMEILQ